MVSGTEMACWALLESLSFSFAGFNSILARCSNKEYARLSAYWQLYVMVLGRCFFSCWCSAACSSPVCACAEPGKSLSTEASTTAMTCSTFWKGVLAEVEVKLA